MDMLTLKSKIPRKIFFFTTLLLLSIIGVIRYAVDIFSLSAVANDKPFSIPLPFSVTGLVLVIIVLFLFLSGLIRRYSFSTAFIIAGAFGNFIERLLLSSVKDYINIFVGWINLSDLILWAGLIILNYEFWFKTIDTVEGEDDLQDEEKKLEELQPKSQLKNKIRGIRNDLDEINNLIPEPKQKIEQSLERDSYLRNQQKYEQELIKDSFNKLAQEPDMQELEEHILELKDDLTELRNKTQVVQSIKVSKDDDSTPKIKIKIN